jgi:hypothetical protein
MAVALAALLATAPALSARGTQATKPAPETRRVFIGATPCEQKDGRDYNPRTLTLSCVARGARLIFYDQQRDAVYEIRFASEEQRVEVLNDFAGTEVNAQGFWEDREGRVKLVGVWKADYDEPSSRPARP